MARFETDNNTKWKNGNKKMYNHIQKSIKGQENLVIDKKRNVNSKEKENIWNNCKTHNQLDPDIFRLDVLGNVIIKDIKYYKNNPNKIFAGEYEHILSHSKGGKSDTNNVCLLNAGINRSKSNNELYTLKFYEMKGLCSVYGMNANQLLYLLRYEHHEFCEKYDLYFQNVNGIFTTKVYNPYKNEVKNQENYDNITSKVASSLAITGLILVVENRNEIKDTIVSYWNWLFGNDDNKEIVVKS
jgi:hypothetical protein